MSRRGGGDGGEFFFFFFYAWQDFLEQILVSRFCFGIFLMSNRFLMFVVLSMPSLNKNFGECIAWSLALCI